MSYDECIAKLQEKAGREISQEEWEQTAEDLQFIVRGLEAGGKTQEEIAKAVAEAAEEARQVGKQAERNALLNKKAFLNANRYLNTVWADNPAEGLRALTYSSLLARQGAADSVEARAERLDTFFKQSLTTDLRRAGVYEILKSGVMDKHILAATHARARNDSAALAQLPQEAVTISTILSKHSDARRMVSNEAGANIAKLDERTMKQTTDPNRLEGRREEWVQKVMSWLDWDRSLLSKVQVEGPDGSAQTWRVLTDEEKVKELNRLFTSFESGVHIDLTKADPTGMKGMGNVAKALSHDRVLVFKPEHEFDYLREFGLNSIFETTMHEIDSMSRATALMEKFGPNARATLQKVYETQQKRLKVEGRTADMQKLEDQYRHIERKILPLLTGEANMITPANATGAWWGATLRAVARMSALGMSAVSSLSDEAVAGAVHRYTFGGSLTTATARSIVDMFGGAEASWKSPEVRELLADMAVRIDAERGMILNPAWQDDGAAGVLDRAQQHFFQFNGQRWWSDKNRAVHTLRAAAAMGRASDKTFDKLTPDLQRSLLRFDIDAPRWELLRQAAGKEIDGTMFLDPRSVGDIADERVSAWLSSTGVKPTPTAVAKAKAEAADALRTFYSSYANAVVTHPDLGTKASLSLTEDKGTFKREAWDTALLFKTFPFAHVRQNLGRELYGRSDEFLGLDRILRNDKGSIANMASFMVASTVLGAASLTVKELLKGRTPVDPTENPMAFAMKSFAQGGGVGMYADFFLGQIEGGYGSGPVVSAMGPAVGLVNTAWSIYNGLLKGDVDQSGAAFRLLLNNIPGRNLPYTAAAFDTFATMAASEWINPGYGRRVDQNMKERTGQTRWAAPLIQEFVSGP